MKVFSVTLGNVVASSKFHQTKDDRPFNSNNFRGSMPSDLNNASFTIYDDDYVLMPHKIKHNKSGSLSNPQSPRLRNPFSRSRSNSGKYNVSAHHYNSTSKQEGLVWPTSINMYQGRHHQQVAGHEYQNFQFFSNGLPPKPQEPEEEPIYSEPLPMNTNPHQVRAAERTKVASLEQSKVAKLSSTNRNHELSTHIYEYLVTRQNDVSTHTVANGNASKSRNFSNQVQSLTSLCQTEGPYRHGGFDSSKPTYLNGHTRSNGHRRGSVTSTSPSSAGSMGYSSSKTYNGESTDATSSNEATNLQNRLRSLSTGLAGLRTSMHENGIMNDGQRQQQQQQHQEQQNYCNVDSNGVGLLVNNYVNGGEAFNTLRSVRSHVTEVSSVMTANVSDPNSNNSSGENNPNKAPPAASISQLSPPRPISTLQHNYNNIQQPAPVMPTQGTLQQPPPCSRPMGPNSLPSCSSADSPNSASPFAPPTTVSSSASTTTMTANLHQTVGLPQPQTGAFSRIAVRPRTPNLQQQQQSQEVQQQQLQRARVPRTEENLVPKAQLAQLRDLIHLEPPITEDAILRTLQARFFNQKYFTNVGPIVLSMNPYRDVGNPLTLTSTRNCAKSPELAKVVEDVIRLQNESGYPQAIIISGSSGSGKTHTSMVVLRQLFEMAGSSGRNGGGGGGTETDAFKHLSASFTVLRSLGSAKTTANRESSRIGQYIEVQVGDGALYRTKIHCYFLDQSRVVKPLPMEKNYHIFYQMLAGLTMSERKQLGLNDLTAADFAFLNHGDTRLDEAQAALDAQRFAEWKTSLSVLGIPFMDVVRVMAAILLLGNVDFAPRGGEESSFDVEVVGSEELNAVASLLGVPVSLLNQGLTERTHKVRGQPVKSMSDRNLCYATRNALAKSLYNRTVVTIVRRANSLKRPVGPPTSGTISSDSNESALNQRFELATTSSTVGTAGSRRSAKSMALLNSAVKHAMTDGFIGILDMFGFEDGKPSQLEQVCINLCSETMQHFYNTHIFKSSMESCKDEGIINADGMVDYVDNVPVIDLISSLQSGLLRMLDVECSVRGCPETYVQKVKVQHKHNKKLFEPKHCDITRTFGIHHYAGQVIYDTTEFLDTNRDVIPDDLVAVFHRETCNFGFANHLFANEIKALSNMAAKSGSLPGGVRARGVSFRISSTSTHPTELLNGDEPVSTLTQDFHTRLDNLLRTLVHAKPHFVRCMKPNEHDSLTEFDRTLVVQQIRSLQIVETVELMANGFPHRMRFRAFNARYRPIAVAQNRPLLNRGSGNDDKAVDDCETILDCYSKNLKSVKPDLLPRNTQWAHGRKHVFLSEGARQQLEQMRDTCRNRAALVIQRLWRQWKKVGSATPIKGSNQTNNSHTINGNKVTLPTQGRPRPQPITGTPPPAGNDFSQVDRCDQKVIMQTCALFGLDLERPPPVPPSRPYTIVGNKKVNFPQTRIMKHSYTDPSAPSEISLLKGESIVVLGVSPKRGHLVVEKKNQTIHVPYQYLEMKPVSGKGL